MQKDVFRSFLAATRPRTARSPYPLTDALTLLKERGFTTRCLSVNDSVAQVLVNDVRLVLLPSQHDETTSHFQLPYYALTDTQHGVQGVRFDAGVVIANVPFRFRDPRGRSVDVTPMLHHHWNTVWPSTEMPFDAVVTTLPGCSEMTVRKVSDVVFLDETSVAAAIESVLALVGPPAPSPLVSCGE